MTKKLKLFVQITFEFIQKKGKEIQKQAYNHLVTSMGQRKNSESHKESNLRPLDSTL